MHWVASLGGIAVIAVLLGTFSLSQMGGGTASAPFPSATASRAPGATATATAAASKTASSAMPTAAPSAAVKGSFRPLSPADLVTGITASDFRWIGPRVKSNMLAVTGGPTTESTNVSALAVPEPGATAAPATQGSNAEGVVDSDPAWDPHAGILAFARLQNGLSEIRYVVPKTGLMPDGSADTGINVKDVQPGSREGRYDHAPVWRGDRNLLFARALSCPNGPAPDCREDIRLATVGARRGDYFAPITETTAYARGWGDVRSIAVDPHDDGRILVTGINLSSRTPVYGVWLVSGTDQRLLLPGSAEATHGIFASDGRVVAIEGGSRWGPVILHWQAGEHADPTRIDVATIVGAALPADTEFASISLSPTGDGRFAVLATDPEAVLTGRPPTIAILDHDLNLIQVFQPVPPAPPDKPTVWNVLTGLAW